jgi:hypothetical protein
MKNLWIFGCSFSQPFFEYMHPNNEDSGYNKYKKYHDGKFPLTWSELLAKKIGFQLKNCAKGGSCNYRIINRFNKFCHEIQEDDIVIIQWTLNERFWVENYGELVEVSALAHCKKPDFTDNSLEEWFVHRNKKSWVNEIYDFQLMMDNMARLGKFNIFYWSADDQIINSENHEFKSNPKYLMNFATGSVIEYLNNKYNGQLTIEAETNGEVSDVHYGVKGQQLLCDLIYDDLKNKNVLE